jgi:hypothetical protein
MEKSMRQVYVDIIMEGDEDNETELEFLETLTLAELKALSESMSEESDEEL